MVCVPGPDLTCSFLNLTSKTAVTQNLQEAEKIGNFLPSFHMNLNFVFFLRQSPRTPACPEIYHADQAGLVSQTLGFKVCTTIPHPAINILEKKI